MATNPFMIDQGNPLQGLGQLGMAFIQKQQQDEQMQARQALQQESQTVLESGDPAMMSQFMVANPSIAPALKQAASFKDESTKQNAIESSLKIIQGGDTDSILRDRAAFVSRTGGDPSGTLKLIGDPERAKKMATVTLAANMEPAQLKAMQEAGFLNKKDGIGSNAKVGAQEILEDGTVIQSTGKGVKVYSPTGELVTGQSAADTIKMARAEKVSNLRKAAGQKKLATLEAQNELEGEVQAGIISQKEAANASIKAFDKIQAINQTISSYNEAIQLIDEGADTGVIESKFPSIKAASLKLDNLQNRLGLDVVSNTTFGALSAGELALAMSTALPKGLDGPDLKDWLIEKKAAQEKMADYLESAAIYLGTPGNTKVGWLKKKRLEQRGGKTPKADSNLQAPQRNQQGWGLMVDAQGNRAYVGPNGEIEEVQ